MSKLRLPTADTARLWAGLVVTGGGTDDTLRLWALFDAPRVLEECGANGELLKTWACLAGVGGGGKP